MQRYLRLTAIVSMLVGLAVAAEAAEKQGYATGKFGLEIEGPKSGHLDPVESANPNSTQRIKPGVSAPLPKPVVVPKRLAPEPAKKKPRPGESKSAS